MPTRMFVGNAKQNGATDYDEEVTFYHHLEGRIGFNSVNPSLSAGKDYPVHSLNQCLCLIVTKLPELTQLTSRELGSPEGSSLSSHP